MRCIYQSTDSTVPITRSKNISIQSEQSTKYFPISWAVYFCALGFSAHRYMGRGLGDRDAYIIGAIGMLLFLFLGMIVRKGNKVS